MFQNNKGFFFPTLMVYILIFLMFLSFMVYNSLANTIMLDSFKQEIYYEQSLLKSQYYIKNYVEFKKGYKSICKQKPLKESLVDTTLKVQPYCVISMFGDFYDKFEKNIALESGNMEITQEQYKEQLSLIKEYNENQKTIIDPNFIERNFEKLVNFLVDKIPEVEEVKKSLGKIFNRYILFDIEISSNEKRAQKEAIIVFYDYKKGEVKTLQYT